MNDMMESNSQSDLHENETTRIIATVIGILLAIAGFEHGLFEALQGDKSTDGLVIQSVGETMRWWKHGTEEAFTIIPNYLITGICAMSVSVFIIVWSLLFVDKKHGTIVFLLLFILLTLVGGGIGFTPFYIVTWAYATRISKTLNWWRKMLTQRVRKHLAKIWPYTLVATAICWLLAIEIAIWGYFPGQEDPEIILSICWMSLLLAMIFTNLSFVSGFAQDIESTCKLPKNQGSIKEEY
jgi:hypothetical protein